MDETRTCPSWWPQLLWDLHFQPRPWPGPGPVNYPPIIDHIMANLHVHTLSYLIIDQEAGGHIRAVAELQLKNAVSALSTFHDKPIDKLSAEVPTQSAAAAGMPTVTALRANAEQILRDAADGLSNYGNTGAYASEATADKSPFPPHYSYAPAGSKR